MQVVCIVIAVIIAHLTSTSLINGRVHKATSLTPMYSPYTSKCSNVESSVSRGLKGCGSIYLIWPPSLSLGMHIVLRIIIYLFDAILSFHVMIHCPSTIIHGRIFSLNRNYVSTATWDKTCFHEYTWLAKIDHVLCYTPGSWWYQLYYNWQPFSVHSRFLNVMSLWR